MKCLKLASEMTKSPTFSNFQGFHAFFPNFRPTLWIGTLKRVNKERMCCLVCFSEKFRAVCYMKNSQIDTENNKKPKSSNFQFFYCIFCNGLDGFLDRNDLKGQQGKNWLSSRLSRRVCCSFLRENFPK